MKVKFLLAILIVMPFLVRAQVPHKISYQAVIRNSSNVLVTNSTISMRVSLLQGTSTGTVVYSEGQSPTTNANGLATIAIGTGSIISGIFDSIDWAAGPYFVKTETDPYGGTSYSIVSTQQLMSVPYALYAEKSGVPGAVDLPTVTTGSSVTGITYSGANAQGTVVTNGGELILSRGICIDTTIAPTIATCFVSPGSSIGLFSVTMSGLLPGKRYYIRAFATNSNGTAYGDTLSFVTNALSAPTVSTDTVSSITNVSAVSGGNVTIDGGSPVTARGICYSTTASPTIASSLAAAGSGTGIFSTSISGLTPFTTYYARAYATNAVGTSYGVQRTFTTVLYTTPFLTTDSVINVAYTTATSGVNTSADGGTAITAQGICYATTPTPTIASSRVTTGTGVGHFTANITGLTPGTTYYVRAYSTNTTGTNYGAQQTFTTLSLSAPVLTTNTVIGVGTTNATSGGNITVGGGSTVTVRGVCWSRFGTPTKDSTRTTDGTGTGLYNSNITGLLPGTAYTVRAYATNTTGTGYGAPLSFTTTTFISTPTVPVLGTISPVPTSSSLITGGYVSIGDSITARGIVYSTSPSPTTASSRVDTTGGLGYFNVSLSLPGCGTNYFLRAYATNSVGTGYGNEYTQASGFLPTIVDSSISSIDSVSARTGAFISSDGGCSVTARGVCWGVAANPTIANFRTINGSGTGGFSATLTGLYTNFTYHMRTYATNSRGTAYGADQVFTTSLSGSRHIGEYYGGGIIFYVDGSGAHGLIAAASDFSSNYPWGCQGTVIGDTAAGVGTGHTNTATIIANCSTPGTAAYACDTSRLNGYNDWFLPSRYEFNLIYDNLIRYGLTTMNFCGNGYWTSTEYYTTGTGAGVSSWYVYSYDGGTCCPTCSPGLYHSNQNKASSIRVRAVRRF